MAPAGPAQPQRELFSTFHAGELYSAGLRARIRARMLKFRVARLTRARRLPDLHIDRTIVGKELPEVPVFELDDGFMISGERPLPSQNIDRWLVGGELRKWEGKVNLARGYVAPPKRRL